MKVLFLDIDGVLNGHQWMTEAGCCGIDRANVRHLNHVLGATGCKIVLSSAWRYIVHGGDMTLRGFEYMLRVSGGACPIVDKIIGVTNRDEDCSHCGWKASKRHRPNVSPEGNYLCPECTLPQTRGAQITRWLLENGTHVDRYCVVDDCDLGISAASHPFVQTNGKHGLALHSARKIVRLLTA